MELKSGNMVILTNQPNFNQGRWNIRQNKGVVPSCNLALKDENKKQVDEIIKEKKYTIYLSINQSIYINAQNVRFAIPRWHCQRANFCQYPTVVNNVSFPYL